MFLYRFFSFQRLIREEWEALKEKEKAEKEAKEREKMEKEVIQLLIVAIGFQISSKIKWSG